MKKIFEESADKWSNFMKIIYDYKLNCVSAKFVPAQDIGVQ